ncbi:XrtA/PEP-CTERM system histidine kinase PrsK [Teredinibacter sp. KSP-S5-2]|uniref:XrtA/PEP-CTERM system histidine kinase PrsK n=1 Tax=Teredinibacter sp. KSP-S5-2 TaxID=3034506 RepID=UPI0029350404|nr:XrtA/PEP-CTERM system histidine kinase PrsK [Teredinibacter sp. KSP-S5-2]WNO08587.1 PEP-CTERM system histidine kinase PrsK [Teredinibacter sp. KSP-S5-2]
MEFSVVTQNAFLSAAGLSFALTLALLLLTFRSKYHWSLPLAAFVQTLWLVTLAGVNQWFQINLKILLFAEALHYSLWLLALIQVTQQFSPKILPGSYKYSVMSICFIAILLTGTNTQIDILGSTPATLVLWQGIFLSIAGLLAVEQLYRNVLNLRFIKLLCIGLGVCFAFDAYLFSQNLVFTKLGPDFWQIRAAVSMATSVLLALGALTFNHEEQQSVRLSLSRPVAFYTTSLSIAGMMLCVLAIGGYYVQIKGGNWGTIIYTLILVGGLLIIAFTFISRTLRENLNVWINKHLFSHKYDYRAEWLKLINQLSQPTEPEEVPSLAINVVSDVFKCHGGALWLMRGKVLVPVKQVHMGINIANAFEPDDSRFTKALREEEWVFCPKSSDPELSQRNEYLPDWILDIENLWLILPLLSETHLVGFMALAEPKTGASLNWEDLDLLKTVGRQVAAFLKRHEQSEQLTESRQFDAFNKLSAFVMHDLKNLIAQQSLVVKNAEKHKDNPAFVEDAIQTVSNSVARMSNLLRKLQHNEPESVKTLTLQDVLIEAVSRCQKSSPAAKLGPVDPGIKIKADFDSLTMVFTHIIQNAQDATPAEGYVDIDTRNEKDNVVISIEDNGIGMDDEFINERLFKPFETTKSGKGMGIGVYQAKEYTQNLGGTISVESSPGEGTTFIITLPILKTSHQTTED